MPAKAGIHTASAQPLGQARFDWMIALWRGNRALLRRRRAEFERWNEQVARLGRDAGSGNAEILAFGQRWLGLIDLGEIDEAVAFFSAQDANRQNSWPSIARNGRGSRQLNHAASSTPQKDRSHCRGRSVPS